MTQEGKVCAWSMFRIRCTLSRSGPGSGPLAASVIRCGVLPGTVTLTQSAQRGLRMTEKTPQGKPGLPAGGGGHPRMESKGLSTAVSDLWDLQSRLLAVRKHSANHGQNPASRSAAHSIPAPGTNTGPKRKLWSRLEQGLRVSDLLLQAGGFSCIVLDMAVCLRNMLCEFPWQPGFASCRSRAFTSECIVADATLLLQEQRRTGASS